MDPLRSATRLAVASLLWPGLATASPAAPAQASNGMVVTSQHLASEVGVEILKQGGNAIDAAVAVGYALAVVEPCCGNLGGGGFMTIHLADGSNYFVDFREKAPAAATVGMYLDAQGNVVPDLSRLGYRAVGVPGTVLGLESVRQRFGTMTRDRLVAPAVALAEQGFVLADGDTDYLRGNVDDLAKQPNVAAIFTKNGKPLEIGDRLIQPDLARSLEAIAKAGVSAFYGGDIGDAIAAASQANGGVLTRQDILDYSIEQRQALTCDYRGYVIVTAPPPSSGGTTLCEILNVLEGYPLRTFGFHSPAAIHAMVEAMRYAYADRNTLGDPTFVTNPVERLTSKAYADTIRHKIGRDATPSTQVASGAGGREGNETTHYSVVDSAGNAVAVTYTINGPFGAKVIAGNTGFFLNDEMDDFTAKPGVPNMFSLVQGKANAIAPHKRPLSSMSPTIVTKDGKVVLVLGSPGGSRIITTVLQTIVNVIDYDMPIGDAVDAPRIHHQWQPDEVDVEPQALSKDEADALTRMGYKVVEQAPWGSVEAIAIAPGDKTDAVRLLSGAKDRRRPAGAVAGY